MKRNKILSLILCATLVLSIFSVSTVVDAVEKPEYNITQFRKDGYGNYTYPEKDGYVFAGWYQDEALTIPVDYQTTDGTAYAKFVDPAVFTVKFQLEKGTNIASPKTSLRMITSVDSKNYYTIKFQFEALGESAILDVNTIYDTIYGFQNNSEQPYTPSIFSETDSTYFAVQKITDIRSTLFSEEFKVTPIYETMDGTVIQGEARTMNINQKADLNKQNIIQNITLPLVKEDTPSEDAGAYSLTGTETTHFEMKQGKYYYVKATMKRLEGDTTGGFMCLLPYDVSTGEAIGTISKDIITVAAKTHQEAFTVTMSCSAAENTDAFLQLYIYGASTQSRTMKLSIDSLVVIECETTRELEAVQTYAGDITQTGLAITDDAEDFENQIYAGYSCCAVGDSLSASVNYWPNYVAAQTGIKMDNNAIGGTSISTNGSPGNSFVERILGLNGQAGYTKDYDLWVIYGGANDSYETDKIGDLSSTDNSTMCGALNNIITHLKARPNNPKIVLVASAAVEEYYKLRNDAVRQIAEKYDLPVIDLEALSGIDSSNKNTYTDDGVHPNAAGAQIHNELILSELKRLVQFDEDGTFSSEKFVVENNPGNINNYTEITISDSSRVDSPNLLFEVSANDEIPTSGWTYVSPTSNGRIYIDGVVKAGAYLIKHASTGYLLYFPNFGVEPVEGMTVKIEGEFQFDAYIYYFLPATFVYEGNNDWILVEREIPGDSEEPEEDFPTVTLSYTGDTDSSRKASDYLFFTTSAPDELYFSGVTAYDTSWLAEGGVTWYSTATQTEYPLTMRLYKFASNQYYLPFGEYGIQPQVGDTVSIAGVLTDVLLGQGTEHKVRFAPVTFTLQEGNNWVKEGTSEEPEETIQTVTLSYTGDTDSSRKASDYLFFTTSAPDELYFSGVTAYDTSWLAEGGVTWYSTATQTEYPLTMRLYKFASNQYYLPFGEYGIQPQVGDTVSIAGVLTDVLLGQGTEHKVRFAPVTFTLQEGDNWVITSTE